MYNPLASMHFHCHELSMDHSSHGFPWTSKDWGMKVWYQTTPPCTLPLSHDVWTNKKSFPGWTIQDAKHTIAAQEGVPVHNQRLLKGMTELANNAIVGEVLENGDTLGMLCDVFIYVRGWKTGKCATVFAGSCYGTNTIAEVKMGRWSFRAACLFQK